MRVFKELPGVPQPNYVLILFEHRSTRPAKVPRYMRGIFCDILDMYLIFMI